MRLANAMVVFAISKFLRMFLLICPLCSIWKYYNSTRHVHIILSELVLLLVVASIMFGSLALTKMNCNRIANYFLLPILFGLGYLNLAHYHREIVFASKQSTATTTLQPDGLAHKSQPLALQKDSANTTTSTSMIDSGESLADSIELILCRRLALLSVVHLITNAFSEQIGKIIK